MNEPIIYKRSVLVGQLLLVQVIVPAVVAIRPESIRLTRMQAPDIASFKGTVTHRIFLGSSAEYAVTVPGLGDFLVTADRRSMN